MFYFEKNKLSFQSAMRYVGEFDPFTRGGWNLLFEIFTEPDVTDRGPAIFLGMGSGLGSLKKVIDNLISPEEQARQRDISRLLDQSAPHGTKPHRRWPVPK